MKWKIPMTWQVYGVCEVEANTLEEAKDKALAWDTDLPCGTYVTDSAELDNEEIIEKMNKNNLTLQDE